MDVIGLIWSQATEQKIKNTNKHTQTQTKKYSNKSSKIQQYSMQNQLENQSKNKAQQKHRKSSKNDAKTENSNAPNKLPESVIPTAGINFSLQFFINSLTSCSGQPEPRAILLILAELSKSGWQRTEPEPH